MNNIYLNLDCLPELKKYSDNSFDIGVVDVNYGIGESSKKSQFKKHPGQSVKRKKKPNQKQKLPYKKLG